jgi:hypothetical protein
MNLPVGRSGNLEAERALFSLSSPKGGEGRGEEAVSSFPFLGRIPRNVSRITTLNLGLLPLLPKRRRGPGRGGRSFFVRFMHGLGRKSSLLLARDERQFSLSPRERAGVRGKRPFDLPQFLDRRITKKDLNPDIKLIGLRASSLRHRCPRGNAFVSRHFI